MKDLWIVAKYTFKDLVRRKSFIIANIIILIFILVGFNIPNIIKNIKGDDDSSNMGTKILIVDKDNIFEGVLQNIPSEQISYDLEVSNEDIPYEEIKNKIEEDEIEVLVVEKQENMIKLNYWVKTMGMTTFVPEDLITILESTYKNIQISKLNLTQQQLNIINIPFEVSLDQVSEKEVEGNIFAMMLLSIVLFYAIYFFAYQVSTSITTEKNSKIIETLVTSTSPRTIVLGKTIGIGSAGIMQTIITAVFAVICAKLFLSEEIISSVLDLSNITLKLGIITLIYYFLGYLFFALLYALTGSTVSKPEDIQSANGPVAILAVIGFYLSYFTMMNPTSKLNEFAAIFPISSPFCMPFRVMMGLATTSEIAISIAVLLVTIFVVANVSIKIYSSAILNYGTKLSIKDIVKMYKEK